MRRLITIKNLDKWGACCRDPGEPYNDKRLKRLFKGRKSIPTLEVLNMKNIPPEDRVWVMTRSGVLTKRQRDQWLAEILKDDRLGPSYASSRHDVSRLINVREIKDILKSKLATHLDSNSLFLALILPEIPFADELKYLRKVLKRH
jgi:hypothetical protein